MGLETGSFISALVSTNPVGATDPKSQGDDHIRFIKAKILETFPNVTGAVTATHAELNLVVGATQGLGTLSAQLVSISAQVSLKAPLASPTLTGTPTSPTYTATTVGGGIANISFVMTPYQLFSAYMSGNQTVTSSTWTKVNIDTKEFDPSSVFDAVTNHRFTPTIAGYYEINFQLQATINVANGLVASAVYKNGVIYKQGLNNDVPNSGNTGGSGGSIIVSMNGTTDYLELYGYVDGVGFVGGATYSWMMGRLIK